jgi:hypothetical protein
VTKEANDSLTPSEEAELAALPPPHAPPSGASPARSMLRSPGEGDAYATDVADTTTVHSFGAGATYVSHNLTMRGNVWIGGWDGAKWLWGHWDKAVYDYVGTRCTPNTGRTSGPIPNLLSTCVGGGSLPYTLFAFDEGTNRWSPGWALTDVCENVTPK